MSTGKKSDSKNAPTDAAAAPVVAPAPAEGKAKKGGKAKAEVKSDVVAPVVAPVVVAEVKADAAPKKGGKAKVEAEGEDDPKQRYFKCVYNGEEATGRYCGKKPKQAANKALTYIIRTNGGADKCVGKQFKFEMVECTRGCNKKRTLYEGERVKLPKPLVVKIKGGVDKKTGKKLEDKEISYKYQNKLHKVKEPVKGGKAEATVPKPRARVAKQ